MPDGVGVLFIHIQFCLEMIQKAVIASLAVFNVQISSQAGCETKILPARHGGCKGGFTLAGFIQCEVTPLGRYEHGECTYISVD